MASIMPKNCLPSPAALSLSRVVRGQEHEEEQVLALSITSRWCAVTQLQLVENTCQPRMLSPCQQQHEKAPNSPQETGTAIREGEKEGTQPATLISFFDFWKAKFRFPKE